MMQVRHSTQLAKIDDDDAIELQNFWLQTIQFIYRMFDNQKVYLKDITKSEYIRELVDTRNKIAHGEKLTIYQFHPDAVQRVGTGKVA